jgi:hypothetical protein
MTSTSPPVGGSSSQSAQPDPAVAPTNHYEDQRYVTVGALGREGASGQLILGGSMDEPGPPAVGVHEQGEVVVDGQSHWWECIAAGEPGIWRLSADQSIRRYDPASEYRIGQYVMVGYKLFRKMRAGTDAPGTVPTNPLTLLTTIPSVSGETTAEAKKIKQLYADPILNRVYVGYGDYNANTGPCDIVSFDASGTVTVEETMGTEQTVYCPVDDEIWVPAVDPTQSGLRDDVMWRDPDGTWHHGTHGAVFPTSIEHLHFIGPGPNPGEILAYGGKAAAAWPGNSNDAYVWQSLDGGATWTVLFHRDATATGQNYLIYGAVKWGDIVYFSINSSSFAFEYYKYDGVSVTAATDPVDQFNTGVLPGGVWHYEADDGSLWVVQGSLYRVAPDGTRYLTGAGSGFFDQAGFTQGSLDRPVVYKGDVYAFGIVNNNLFRLPRDIPTSGTVYATQIAQGNAILNLRKFAILDGVLYAGTETGDGNIYSVNFESNDSSWEQVHDFTSDYLKTGLSPDGKLNSTAQFSLSLNDINTNAQVVAKTGRVYGDANDGLAQGSISSVIGGATGTMTASAGGIFIATGSGNQQGAGIVGAHWAPAAIDRYAVLQLTTNALTNLNAAYVRDNVPDTIFMEVGYWVSPRKIYPITASATLALNHSGAVIDANHATVAIALTVPPNSAVACRIGTEIPIRRGGAAAVTLVAGAGVTINNNDANVLPAQRTWGMLRKVGTDEWDWVPNGSGVDTTNMLGFVNHGSDSTVARPDFGAVWWRGTVEPDNWLTDVDYWDDTT